MRFLIAATAALLAPGCSDPAPEQVAEADAPMPVEPDGGIGDGAGPPVQTGAASPATIPATMQGRWGLVPADCASTEGDAKGLLVIGPDRLSFYESRGTLRDVRQNDGRGFRAVYAFTGEGMEWMRDIAFEIDQAENRLVRRDFGEDAGQPLTYTRCE